MNKDQENLNQQDVDISKCKTMNVDEESYCLVNQDCRHTYNIYGLKYCIHPNVKDSIRVWSGYREF